MKSCIIYPILWAIAIIVAFSIYVIHGDTYLTYLLWN